MYSQNSGKLKDAMPVDTIQRIRSILSDMGIIVTEKWFESVKSNFGKGYSKLLNYWKVIETEEYKSFIQAFINSYNTIANKLHYDTIDDL